MNQLVVSLAWCWAQSLVVGALAIGLSAIALRRSPAAGAAIAWAGVLATLGLSLVAPLPTPQWRLPSLAAREAPILNSTGSQSEPSDATATATNESQPGIALNLNFLRSIAASVEQSNAAIATHGLLGRVALVAFALAAVVSLARTIGGLRAVAMLGTESRPIDDERLAVIIAELSRILGLRTSPLVRESSTLVGAAVIGWHRPAVLLPAAWRQWSPAELKAVLAHELAHIQRRDFALRLVAALTVALQCLQPLVYRLRRQLILAQEIAADDLAASALGSRTEYLHALSQLALRQDARPIDGSVGLLLPVFSGFLLRRIEMLRAKDCSTRRVARPLLQWSAIAILIATAASTTALRSLAQPPETESDGSIRVAKANDSRPKPANVASNEQPQPAGLFRRPPFDLSRITFNKTGGFLLRVGEILKRAEFAGHIPALNAGFAAGWKDAFPEAEAPAWSLADIDYIAGDFKLTFRRNDHPKENDTPDQVMFGATCVVIRWQQPLGKSYDSLLRIPGAEQKTYGEVQYVELPLIPAIGPLKPCVCRLDERSVMFAFGEGFLHKQLDKLAGGPASPSWQREWEAVEGGLVTIVAAGEVIHPLSDEGDPQWKRIVKDVFTQVRQYALGLDWHDGADGLRTLRLNLDCETEESAGLVRAAINDLLAQAVEESRKLPPTEAESKAAKEMIDFLQQLKTESRQIADRWQVEVRFTGPLDIQQFFTAQAGPPQTVRQHGSK
jgi:beta-lactamase regulating signal transducer with metallopeptidase domain